MRQDETIRGERNGEDERKEMYVLERRGHGRERGRRREDREE